MTEGGDFAPRAPSDPTGRSSGARTRPLHIRMAATANRRYANRPVDVTSDMIEEAFREGHAATTVLLGSHWLRANRDDFFTVLNYAEMLYLTNQYEDAIGVYESALRRF